MEPISGHHRFAGPRAARALARARCSDRALFFVCGVGKDVRWPPLSGRIVQVRVWNKAEFVLS